MARQLALPRTAGWGGRRAGAGRKRVAARPQVPHRPRPAHRTQHPVHLTWRVVPGLPSLRSGSLFPRVLAALGAQCAARVDFRVAHFSVQDDHLHLLVEAHDSSALRAGAQGLGVRLARAINRALGRRGRVLEGRFHARPCRTPREVRRALVYVLMNFRKHTRAMTALDPCSSAASFDGFRLASSLPRAELPVHAPRTWLLRKGWRRRGLLGLDEAPA